MMRCLLDNERTGNQAKSYNDLGEVIEPFISTEDASDATPDRYWLWRQVLRTLMCIGAIAVIVGLVARHVLMSVLGVVDLIITVPILLRLPAPTSTEPEDGD